MPKSSCRRISLEVFPSIYDGDLSKINKDLNENSIYEILDQILERVSLYNKKGFYHNDIHLKNMFYIKNDNLFHVAMGDFSDVTTGFYGGASAGIMVMLSETIFINAEYEWAYMSNTYYLDRFVNSAMGGIGMRF